MKKGTRMLMLAVFAVQAWTLTAQAHKPDLVADLICKGKNEEGAQVQVLVNGVTNKVTVKRTEYQITWQSKKENPLEIYAERGKKSVAIRFSKHLAKFHLKSDEFGKIKGRCTDSLGNDLGDDDDEHDPGDLFLPRDQE